MNPSYTNPSSPAPSPAPIISSGDIVLPSSAPKKSKKPLITIALLSIILIASGLTFWYFTKTTPRSNQAQETPKVSARELFNKYANYLIKGEKDSTTNIDLDQFIETYDIYNPETVYAETANFTDLKAINDLYFQFVDTYEKATLSEAETYFYYYLGCKTESISEEECTLKIGAGYKNLYAPYSDDQSEAEAFFRIVDLRTAAMQALLDTYYDIYDIDITVKSEAI